MMPQTQTQPAAAAPLNLDRLAAQCAQRIISGTARAKAAEVDNTVTKALGVLQENGLYAFFLFLVSRNKAEKPRAKVVAGEALRLLREMRQGWSPPAVDNMDAVLAYVAAHMLDDLDALLLARQTLEQMLIYARYGAKARD